MNTAQSPIPPTRLDRLELKNFRCFSELTVDFHPRLTVIVAPNGGGKTALLDAACFGWKFFTQGMEFKESSGAFRAEDVRQIPTVDGGMQSVKPASLYATVHVEDRLVNWAAHNGGVALAVTSTIKNAGESLRLAVQEHAEGKLSEPPTLPVLGYYGTGRLWDAERITKNKLNQVKPDTSRTGGYDGCLAPNSHFKLFEAWFKRHWTQLYVDDLLEDAHLVKEASPQRPKDKIHAVVKAVNALLKPTGWHSLSFDHINEFIVARHPIHGLLPVSLLSDGIRIMIGLVADIAHRCTRLNPQFGTDAAQMTPGVIMIDEVDMHLHPEWQQQVIDSLLQAFPLIQFIVTTHSPQVLSTVRKENIRIIESNSETGWQAREPSRNPYAHSNSLSLEAVMNGTAYPDLPLTADLREYQNLVGEDQHDSPRALELRARLEKEWGSHDIELQLMDVSIRKNEVLRKVRSKQS